MMRAVIILLLFILAANCALNFPTQYSFSFSGTYDNNKRIVGHVSSDGDSSLLQAENNTILAWKHNSSYIQWGQKDKNTCRLQSTDGWKTILFLGLSWVNDNAVTKGIACRLGVRRGTLYDVAMPPSKITGTPFHEKNFTVTACISNDKTRPLYVQLYNNTGRLAVYDFERKATGFSELVIPQSCQNVRSFGLHIMVMTCLRRLI